MIVLYFYTPTRKGGAILELPGFVASRPVASRRVPIFSILVFIGSRVMGLGSSVVLWGKRDASDNWVM